MPIVKQVLGMVCFHPAAGSLPLQCAIPASTRRHFSGFCVANGLGFPYEIVACLESHSLLALMGLFLSVLAPLPYVKSVRGSRVAG